MVGSATVHRKSRRVDYQCRKRRDRCGENTVDFKLGSGEILAFGAGTSTGSHDLAALIIECGVVRTIFLCFVRITGHLTLSVVNIRANSGRRPCLYTEMESPQ